MDTNDILQTLPAGAMAPVDDIASPADQPLTDMPLVADDAPPATSSETETLAVDRTHTIEHRSFARASADEPMPVTTIAGN